MKSVQANGQGLAHGTIHVTLSNKELLARNGSVFWIYLKAQNQEGCHKSLIVIAGHRNRIHTQTDEKSGTGGE